MAAPFYRNLYGAMPVSIQEALVSGAGWLSYRNRFGSPFEQAVRELRRTDEFGVDDMHADQERRLQRMIRWAAATVPYYRDLFRAEGVDPTSIRRVEDLRNLPTLDKETVRSRTAEFRSEGIRTRSVIPAFSSGTTGTALPLFHTREALGWEYAVIWRQRGWFGIQLGERFAGFGGQQVVPLDQDSPPYWRYDRRRSRMLFSLYHMSLDNLAAYVDELREGFAFWQGYPSSMGLISQAIVEQNIDLGDARPRTIFPSSETLLDFHREWIIEATGAVIADRYGNTEFCVSALQCPDGGYHVDTEFGVVEIDPFEETEDWVRGEVIATGFANRAMPLLRYRTGDVATLRKKGGCSCGRARPLLEEIDGRIEDVIVTPDGRRIGRMDHVFKNTLQIKEAQIRQSSPDEISIRLVPRSGFDDRCEQELENELRTRLGRRIRIHYEQVNHIPRGENGKFRAVVSTLKAPQLRSEAPPTDGDPFRSGGRTNSSTDSQGDV